MYDNYDDDNEMFYNDEDFNQDEDLFEADEREREMLEEIEYQTWAFNLTRHEIVDLMIEAIAEREQGDEFTLPELMADIWGDLDVRKARVASRLFKVKVCTREIRTVYFRNDKKRKNCFIYVKL